MSDQDMQRKFANRDDLIAYLIEQFPDATAVDDNVSPIQGGRAMAESKLRQIEPERYSKTRNFTDGAITQISPYLRHGVLSLAETRQAAVEAVERPHQANKLVNELGWRDYFQRVYEEIGDGIWEDREEYKTGFHHDEYLDELPEEIEAGETGMPCIDNFATELRKTGYLHNHVRMWVAAYVVHWRRVKWQAGARWFLRHLLDGDPASNNLSWQWVASTFSHKPYFFNRQNLEKFTRGKYCKECPLYGQCEFEGSYAKIERDIFPHKPPSAQPEKKKRTRRGNKRRKGKDQK